MNKTIERYALGLLAVAALCFGLITTANSESLGNGGGGGSTAYVQPAATAASGAQTNAVNAWTSAQLFPAGMGQINTTVTNFGAGLVTQGLTTSNLTVKGILVATNAVSTNIITSTIMRDVFNDGKILRFDSMTGAACGQIFVNGVNDTRFANVGGTVYFSPGATATTVAGGVTSTDQSTTFNWGGPSIVWKLKVGTAGSTITNSVTATGVLDFPSISGGTTTNLFINIAGCTTNEIVTLGLPGSIEQGLVFNAFVFTNGAVAVRAANVTVLAIDPAAQTFRVTTFAY